MTTLYTRLNAWLDRRARYARTVAELRAMPWDVAHDLDLDKADARRMARAAVYGG